MSHDHAMQFYKALHFALEKEHIKADPEEEDPVDMQF